MPMKAVLFLLKWWQRQIAQMRRESDLFNFYTIESMLGAVAACLLLAMVINRYQIACVCVDTM